MMNHRTTVAPEHRTVTPAAEDALPSVKKLTKQFAYLDQLRETGITNMYGASPYLERAFGLKRGDGTPILGAWMKTFSDDPPAARAAKAVSDDRSLVKASKLVR